MSVGVTGRISPTVEKKGGERNWKQRRRRSHKKERKEKVVVGKGDFSPFHFVSGVILYSTWLEGNGKAKTNKRRGRKKQHSVIVPPESIAIGGVISPFRNGG